jgi:hypothetical protein
LFDSQEILLFLGQGVLDHANDRHENTTTHAAACDTPYDTPNIQTASAWDGSVR